MPATSLNVTFFWFGVSSFARDLPNESALFPPICICRMITTQITIRTIRGAHERSIAVSVESFGSSALIFTFDWRSSLTRSG